jgi:uncharacterized damage-inducible protein DinB
MLKELESICNKLNECHGVLYHTVTSLSEADAAAIANPQWNVKDELAHLAGAERGMLRIAQASARGENPQLPEGYDNDTYNARQVAKRKDQSIAQILDELKGIHNELGAFLDGISQEQLTRIGEHPLEGEIPLKELLVVIYSHEANHCNEITNALRAARK